MTRIISLTGYSFSFWLILYLDLLLLYIIQIEQCLSEVEEQSNKLTDCSWTLNSRELLWLLCLTPGTKMLHERKYTSIIWFCYVLIMSWMGSTCILFQLIIQKRDLLFQLTIQKRDLHCSHSHYHCNSVIISIATGVHYKSLLHVLVYIELKCGFKNLPMPN